ncbi:MAG: hypothetical protein GY861_15500, partial [bacterium]|nr:hypothetical protein [bacterium]
TFLSFAPKCTPDEPYVPDEKITEAWDDSQQLLIDYMDAHFANRPEPIDETMLIEHCITLIMEIGRSMNKSRDPSVVERMIRVKNNGIRKIH